MADIFSTAQKAELEAIAESRNWIFKQSDKKKIKAFEAAQDLYCDGNNEAIPISDKPKPFARVPSTT